jgi:hypothetical protein
MRVVESLNLIDPIRVKFSCLFRFARPLHLHSTVFKTLL